MQLADVVRRRRNVHRFVDQEATGDEITRDEVTELVDVARRVPSAGFSQGVDFVALVGRAETERFWDTFIGAGDRDRPDERFDLRAAGAVVQVVADPTRYLDRYAAADKVASTGRPELGRDPDAWPVPWWYVDAGMAAVTLVHAAVDRGWDTYLLGLHQHVDEVWAAHGIPGHVHQAGTVVIGRRHPEDRPLGSAVSRRRRPLVGTPDAQLHLGGW